ncbi:hypothetical protein CKAH01_00023 [Colletotrichum kahawae]|uniref:Uncharacterized protein n=1 Tax=Colletotrichum kahawae TaxID=34407 RepID=A0AAD9YWT3_COLKA|nr:hypothetical protein CKAH01_00023 [Colletotrichum kahawae]
MVGTVKPRRAHTPARDGLSRLTAAICSAGVFPHAITSSSSAQPASNLSFHFRHHLLRIEARPGWRPARMYARSDIGSEET